MWRQRSSVCPFLEWSHAAIRARDDFFKRCETKVSGERPLNLDASEAALAAAVNWLFVGSAGWKVGGEGDGLRGICACAGERDRLGGRVGVERVVGKDRGAGEMAGTLRLEAEA
jgi:hypothetical protein